MPATFPEASPQLLALGSVLVVAAAWDLASARIPNWLTLPAAAGALAWHASAAGGAGVLLGASGWLVGVALMIVPWLLGGLGAGDAKLMGTVGAFLGPKGCFAAFLGTALVGLVAAGVLLTWHGSLGPAGRRWFRMGILISLGSPGYEAPAQSEHAPRLRYGLVIAVGTFGVLMLGNRLPGALSLSF